MSSQVIPEGPEEWTCSPGLLRQGDSTHHSDLSMISFTRVSRNYKQCNSLSLFKMTETCPLLGQSPEAPLRLLGQHQSLATMPGNLKSFSVEEELEGLAYLDLK